LGAEEDEGEEGRGNGGLEKTSYVLLTKYFSAMKLKGKRWAGHVARIRDGRGACKIWGDGEGKIHLVYLGADVENMEMPSSGCGMGRHGLDCCWSG